MFHIFWHELFLKYDNRITLERQSNMKWAPCILLILLLSISSLSAKGYKNWGIGPHISFNVPDQSTARYYTNKDAALGLGLNGVVNFDLGKAGMLSYNPVFDIWFRVDSWEYKDKNQMLTDFSGKYVREVKLVDWAINFNLFEARYYPPITKKIKPYVGLGLFSVSIYSYKEEIYAFNMNDPLFYDEKIDAGIGANIYIGTTLNTKSTHTPFFELRGSGSKSAPNTFKMLLGIHFNKK